MITLPVCTWILWWFLGHGTIKQLTQKFTILSTNARAVPSPTFSEPTLWGIIRCQDLSSSSWAKREEKTLRHSWCWDDYIDAESVHVLDHPRCHPTMIYYIRLCPYDIDILTWRHGIEWWERDTRERLRPTYMSPRERTCIHIILVLLLCGRARWNLKKTLLGVELTCQSKYGASIFLNDFDTWTSTLLLYLYKTISPRPNPESKIRDNYGDRVVTLPASVVVSYLMKGFA